ncbi:MAG: hypothetical protein AAF519_15905, partial [Bacteroidota bacterium]
MAKLKYCVLGLCVLIHSNTFSQNENGLRINVTDEGIFIYHNKMIRNEGFNIYRDGEKINTEPIRPVTYPEELQVALGEQYNMLAGAAGATRAQNLYLKLISNRTLNQLAVFLFPSAAKALGKLYIDPIAADGRTKTYKVEFTDELGQPTGEAYQTSVVLSPSRLAAPSDLKVSNKGTRVTLDWEYPKLEKGEDDKVIQFHIFKKTTLGDVKLNDNIIIRNAGVRKHTVSFTALETGITETYYVVALDISQRKSPPSESINFFIRDNMAPPQVSGVTTLAGSDRITVTWNSNTAPDAAGYYVYRSKRMREGYKKINQKPLDLLTTF